MIRCQDLSERATVGKDAQTGQFASVWSHHAAQGKEKRKLSRGEQAPMGRGGQMQNVSGGLDMYRGDPLFLPGR